MIQGSKQGHVTQAATHLLHVLWLIVHQASQLLDIIRTIAQVCV